MPYYLADYHPADDGRGPTLPDSADFLLLADPGPSAGWGLLESDASVFGAPGVRAVAPEVASAIESAKRYPPAIALTRDAAAAQFAGHAPTREAFVEWYVQLLRDHMRRQREAGYLFVEALVDETGYLTRGEFYWVLGPSQKAGLVDWVSSDYFVYSNQAGDFALPD